ncbi:MAG TPA: hypothetical protein VFZ08_12325 [Terriglobia bacterium]|nr:hypothetical protein [Terriglobia bacterium]
MAVRAAALPPDLRKGFALPGAQPQPLPAGREGFAFAPSGNIKMDIWAGKPEAFRKSDGKAVL